MNTRGARISSRIVRPRWQSRIPLVVRAVPAVAAVECCRGGDSVVTEIPQLGIRNAVSSSYDPKLNYPNGEVMERQPQVCSSGLISANWPRAVWDKPAIGSRDNLVKPDKTRLSGRCRSVTSPDCPLRSLD